MKEGNKAACDLTGFVLEHAAACVSVANRVNCVILFREPGTSAQGLIAEGYAMKGFRIDAKSCNWGPMKGFVCVDPRLSKRTAEGGSYAAKNLKWTEESLDKHGHINTRFFAMPSEEERRGWVADTMPIVLSRERIDSLGLTGQWDSLGHLVGRSSQTFTNGDETVTLPWRLVPVRGAQSSWLHGATDDHYVLCVDPSRTFRQLYPAGAEMVPFVGFETILGQCNPNTKDRGFKACVTADYDLFSIWPSEDDAMAARHFAGGALGTENGQGRTMPGGVPRTIDVDTRLTHQGHMEHYRYGNVSPRILTVKVMLNTAIMAAGYAGGNAIHHNDECGNFALAKGSLAECLPLIAFVPPVAGKAGGTKGVETVEDFGRLVREARAGGFKVVAKPEWLTQAGVG
jgi:hypothetical protein